MHVLPRVRELHERFPDVLTVVGVHAGKFTTERRTDRIAEACDRLGVGHPVVNDRQFRVWHDYAVQAWPTIVVVDPEGYVALVAPGEFSPGVLVREIERVVERASDRGRLVPGPDPFAAVIPRHEGTLRFPTRAIVSQGRLWIADTGHQRVLECAFDVDTGTATVLKEHGDFEEPRGLAEFGGEVYVADRSGHAVWRLARDYRVRVAGTGQMGTTALSPGSAERIDLRSPWGLAAHRDSLVIAMAGSHQLWSLDPASSALSLVAGSGGEALADGEPARAALAQPTGLARLSSDALAFADCESSAVRTLAPRSVSTLVGTDLFQFGDRSGTGDEVLLQHCEDVALVRDVLVVADTYNDRLKSVHPLTRECAPWPGEAGEANLLREPAGVWSDGVVTLACDTGHHRVVRVQADGHLAEIRLV